uniref:Uncharacterized protein n=1 Tax=Anguilla anguilla TaxID=7936 RepID=A0A0E9XPE7_ANGAN
MLNNRAFMDSFFPSVSFLFVNSSCFLFVIQGKHS